MYSFLVSLCVQLSMQFNTFGSKSVCLQVACMQFINIVVHSVEDMNFRVHLQFEFTKLGLDDYLEVRRQYCGQHLHNPLT